MTGLFTVKEVNATLSSNVTWNSVSYCSVSAIAGSARGIFGGIEEAVSVEEQLTVKVMPNPSRQDFILDIKSDDLKTPVSVRIMDKLGNVISVQKTIAGANLKVGGARWVSGTYVAEIIQGNRRKLVRLVKL
jgi:hypothetical protein